MAESVKKVLECHSTILKANYNSLLGRIHNLQMQSLYVVEYLDEQEKVAGNENQAIPQKSRVLQEIVTTPASICKPMMDRAGAYEAFNNGNTPKMHIKDFSKSPFALRSKPIALQFYDFETEISNEEFLKVPS